MISYIRGPLMEKLEDSVVVEAGNVGYQIFVPVSVLSALPALGEEVRIYTYFQVREDAMVLFGFLDRRDLDIFKKLLSVNGVGPKSALGILSALGPDEFRLAVVTGDAKRITRAPGIGIKTAQRILLDLKDKVDAESLLPMAEPQADAGTASGLGEAGKEAVEALTALGYSVSEASGAVRKAAASEDMTAEEILKKALKYLAFL